MQSGKAAELEMALASRWRHNQVERQSTDTGLLSNLKQQSSVFFLTRDWCFEVIKLQGLP